MPSGATKVSFLFRLEKFIAFLNQTGEFQCPGIEITAPRNMGTPLKRPPERDTRCFLPLVLAALLSPRIILGGMFRAFFPFSHLQKTREECFESRSMVGELSATCVPEETASILMHERPS